MTSTESRKLRPGMRVVWSDGVQGEVIRVNDRGVVVHWDDLYGGIIPHGMAEGLTKFGPVAVPEPA